MLAGRHLRLNVDDPLVFVQPEDINRKPHVFHPERMDPLLLKYKKHGLVFVNALPEHQPLLSFFVSDRQLRRDRKTVRKIDFDEFVFRGLSGATETNKKQG